MYDASATERSVGAIPEEGNFSPVSCLFLVTILPKQLNAMLKSISYFLLDKRGLGIMIFAHFVERNVSF